MIRTRHFITLLVLFALIAAPAFGQQWLHVSVQERNDESVKINIPLKLAETLLPILEDEGIDDELRAELRSHGNNFTLVDLRELWQVLRNQDNMDFVTVESRHENLRVGLQNDELVVLGDEDDDSTVDIRIPAAVVDALLSGTENELNLGAALRVLSEIGGGELLTIKDDDETVRIWIDNKSSQ